MRRMCGMLAALLLSTSAIHLWALPADLSVAAYKRAVDTCEKKAIATTTEEFEAETKNVEVLSQPFKIKDTVTVHSAISGDLTGVLYSIGAGADPLVQIGDRRVNFSDLSPVDQQRLRLSQMPEDKMRKEIAKLKLDLETKKKNRIEFLAKRKLDAMGYTDSFFLATVILGDSYRVLSELGDRRVQVTLATGNLDEDPKEDYYFVIITNPMTMPTDLVVLWNGKPLATNLALGTTDPALKDQPWKRLIIPLQRVNFGADVPTSITNNLKLELYKQKVGRWELEPVRTTSKAKDSKVVADFTCTLDKAKARDFQPEMAAAFSAAAGEALKVMGTTKEQLEQSLADAKNNIKDLEEKKRKQREEEDRKAKRQEEMKDQEATLVKLEANWISRGATIKEEDGINQQLVIYGSPSFGAVNAQQRLDDNEVLKHSTWQVAEAPMVKDDATSVKVSGYHYRFVHCTTPGDDGAPIFYLQSYIWCQNRGDLERQVTPVLTFNFNAGDKLRMDHTFTVPMAFSGYLVAAKVVTLEQVLSGVKALDVSLGKKAAAPEAGKEEPKTEPKTEPAGDAPKAEAKTDGKTVPKADAAKTEPGKTDAVKGDTPKADAAKTDAPKTDGAKSDTAKKAE